ncbi:MAG: hypothetical protein MK538_03070 [Planctomycetes bacterium]|nr:hypothetical protein [Planctomycetota bacterium]
MKSHRMWCVASVLTTLVCAGCDGKAPVDSHSTTGDSKVAPGELETDAATGLIIDDGWEVVRNSCVACHSAKQFLRQRGTRQTWYEIVRWMEEKEGLGMLPADQESKILDYLTRHHGPVGVYRRAPIAPLLLPKNPYVSDVRKAQLEKRVRQRSG